MVKEEVTTKSRGRGGAAGTSMWVWWGEGQQVRAHGGVVGEGQQVRACVGCGGGGAAGMSMCGEERGDCQSCQSLD